MFQPFRAILVFFVVSGSAAFGQMPDIGDAPRWPAEYRAPQFTSQSVQSSAVLPWIDTSSRAAVQQSYLTVFVPTKSVPMGWTGNISTGDAGTTSQAYKDAVTLRINWIRALAGINSNISLNPTWNSEDQQAALMMSANNQLSHSPPTNWQYYSAAGADAAGHSNICLGFFANDPGCIELYMQDHGSGNSVAGHRRWILYPQSTTMGTGDVAGDSTHLSANALWVIDSNTLGTTRPATRDPFIAWPPKGYVPYQLVYPRWTFSYAGADFSNATVSLQRNGIAVPVRIESTASGYGENTIVFIPDNLDPSQYITPTAPAADTTTTVTVSNVYVNGSAQSFTYNVTVFDPATNGGGSASYSLNPTSTTIGSAGGTGSIGVTVTPTGSTYQAASNASWLVITGGASGTGNGTIAYSAAANTSTVARTAQITVGSATFTLTQSGAACTYAVSPASPTIGSSGGTLTATVTTNGPNCAWTATSNTAWISVTGGASGTGSGTVTYTVSASTGTPRSGTLTIAGQTVTVAQSASTLATQIGIFRASGQGGVLWVRDRNGDGIYTGAPDSAVGVGVIGGAGDQPLIGDWNASGTKKLGIYRPFGSSLPGAGLFVLDVDGNEAWNTPPDRALFLAPQPGDVAVVGHWTGGQLDQTGLFRNGVFYLDVNGNGSFTQTIVLGQAGDMPVVGDWNGDGRSKVGIFRNGLWVLDYNGNGQWDGPGVDRAFYLGTGGDQPVVGDWNGDGRSKAGVFRKSAQLWVLDYNGNGQWDGLGVDKALFNGFDTSTSIAVVGDWTGDGKTKAGTYKDGVWFLDVAGDGSFSRLAFLGQAGDTPIAGKW